MTIAHRRADKTTDRVRTEQERKLTRLQRNKDKKRPKTDDNWVRNISSRPLDKTETHVLSYGLKHSVTPKRIPTESIVSSVEAVLSRQRDLSESAKDNIRSRIASTVQSASIPDNNLTKDEQQALKRLKNDNDIVILPADKGRVTVVMDKTDYFDKMDALVNDKQTYEELKRDPTPSLQRKLNSKILTLKKTDNVFQTKMWHSNLDKFRRVMVFDAEKNYLSERFWLIGRRKRSVQLSPPGQYIQFHQHVQFQAKRSCT